MAIIARMYLISVGTIQCQVLTTVQCTVLPTTTGTRIESSVSECGNGLSINSPISVKMELKRVFWAFFLLFWAPSHELQTFVQGKALSIPDGVVSVTSGEYEINHDFNRINYNLQITINTTHINIRSRYIRSEIYANT